MVLVFSLAGSIGVYFVACMIDFGYVDMSQNDFYKHERINDPI
jgi:hypothetical protein